MRASPFKLVLRPVLLAIVGGAGIVSILASGGGGTGGTGGITAAKTPRYAFVANNGDNSVSTYVVDSTTGRLRWIGKVAAGANPQSVTVDPAGKYAYVVNYGDGTVSPYSIGSDGHLTAIDCDTGTAGVQACTAGASPYSVTVDPSGKYAYVANSVGGTISQYTIGANGALTANAAGATVPAGTSPASVTVDPSGKYAYVANNGGGVSQYTIGATGALTAMVPATVATGTNPISVTVDPSGKYAYVANSGGNSVSAYTISATTGALTQIVCTVSCSGADFSAGAAPYSVTVDPSGKYAYVANRNGGSVSQFTIGAGGGLTAIGTAVAAGTFPQSVTVDPSGKYVYVANFLSSNVSQYLIGTNGGLTLLSPATISSWTSPASVAVMGGSAAVRAVPKYAYVANYGSDSVSAYTISASSGALAQISCSVGCTGSDFSAGANPDSVAVDPSGKYAYVANSVANTVSQYTIGTNGTLSPIGAAVGSGTGPASVAVDPSGKYAYVANSGGGSVSAYSINASTGALAQIVCTVSCTGSDFSAGAAPYSIAVDPSGKYVYVVNRDDATVSQFTIGTNGGLTAIVAAVAAGSMPRSVAVDPSGKYAYVTNSGSVSVTPYSIGSNGALTVIDCDAVTVGVQTCPTGNTPFSIAIDPSGKYAYVTNSTDADVSQYTVGANGSLTLMTPSPTASAELNPQSVAVDPSGKYAYVANYGSANVWQYTIGSSGALASMTPGSISAGNNPASVTTTGTWQ